MRISLVYPRVGVLTHPPLGILYVGAVLERDGHDIQIIDPKPQDKRYPEEIEAFHPDLVGVSIMTTDVLAARRMLSKIKPQVPNALYMAGGPHVTATPSDSIDFLGLDFAIIGEGETTTSEVCRRLEHHEPLEGIPGVVYRKDVETKANMGGEPIRNLDNLPYPARHLTNFERYLQPPGIIRSLYLKRSTTVMASRGCPYHCIYCASHLTFGRKTRRRSVENVLSEIEHLINRYGIDGLYFVDDTFTLDRDWVFRFCQELRERHIELAWAVQARANTIDREILREIKSVGCRVVEFGVESGSARVLKALRKGTTPEMLFRAFALCREVGLKTTAFFIVGNPEETNEDIEKTLRLAKKIKADRSNFYFTTPLPGTELNEMSTKNGWHDPEVLYNEDWDFTEQPIMEINFTKQELIRIRTQLQNAMVLRNHIGNIKNLHLMSKMIFVLLRRPVELMHNLKKLLMTRRVAGFTEFAKRAYERYQIERTI